MAIDTVVSAASEIDPWPDFRKRVIACEDRALYMADWLAIRPLLNLAPADALTALRACIAPMDDAAFERFAETFVLVMGKSMQRAGVMGVTDAAEFASRWSAYFTQANPETAALAKLQALKAQLGTLRQPLSAQPLSEAEQSVYRAGSALDDRLMIASAGALPGHATDEGLAVLVGLIGEFRASLATTAHDNRMRRMLLDGLESAMESAGNAAFLLFRASEAKTWTLLAATMYESRGELANARRCRNRAGAIDAAVAGDIDAAIRPNLEALIGESDGDRAAREPLDRVANLVVLVTQSVGVGDTAGAKASLDQAVAALRDLGYDDPYDRGVDDAFAGWMRALPLGLEGTPMLRTVANVADAYVELLGARATLAANDGDPASEARARGLLPGMNALSSRLFAESNAAIAALAVRWDALLEHALLAPGPEPAPAPAAANAQPAPAVAPVDDIQNRILALGDALYAAMNESDRRIAAGAPLDDLLITAASAAAEAAALRQPVYAALAALLRGDILLNSNRAAEALPEVRAARDAWTAVFPVTDGGDAQQRSIDVQFLTLVMRAYGMLGDTASLFATSGEAIALVERDRYKTSSPYQQGAYLKNRAQIYQLGIISAFKLGNYGAMLERAELAKARAALRSRYLPDAPQTEATDLERRFGEISARIAAGSTPELQLERRRIWDLIEIDRLRAAGTIVPDFSLSALQGVLGPGEAILYYYWLLPDVLLVAAIDSGGIVVERVTLTDADVATFADLIALLKTARPLNDNFDDALQSFFATLLPPKIATFVEDKTRVIVSPHRALHVFPFHAMKWNGKRLVERFALSYTPNLSVLLSPVVPATEPRVLLVGVGDFARVAPAPAVALVPLPGVAAELKSADDAYGGRGIARDVLANENVTRAWLRAANDADSLKHYTTIVLATHGTSVFDIDAVAAPMESHVYLFDAAIDGLDVSRLRLRAELVVLSACFSGQRAVDGRDGADLPGDDLFGLQAALNMAGAGAVLGCLWAADDDVTACVMQAFHRARAEGAAADVALQRAVVGHLQTGEKSDPFYWASFFISTMSGHIRST